MDNVVHFFVPRQLRVMTLFSTLAVFLSNVVSVPIYMDDINCNLSSNVYVQKIIFVNICKKIFCVALKLHCHIHYIRRPKHFKNAI